MATDIQLLTPAGAALPQWTPTITAGTPSATDTFEVWNDKGGTSGADTARNLRLVVTPANVAAEIVYTEGWHEARVTGGLNVTATPTPWVRLAPGSALDLPDLESDQGVTVERRVVAPADLVDVVDADLSYRVESSDAIARDAAGWAAGDGGILPGLGDLAALWIARSSGDVTANGADDDLTIPDLSWVHQGIPYGRVEQLQELDATDGDSATLAAGESYIAVLTLGTDLTVTKGSKAVAPTAPAAPAGELLLAEAVRDDTGVIDTPDVTVTGHPAAYTVTDTTGLVVTLEASPILTGGQLVVAHGVQQVTLSPSTTSYVWRTSGGLAVTSAETPPIRGAELLYEFVTNATDVTATTDRRRYLPPQTVLEFAQAGVLADADEIHGHLPTPAWLDPYAPVSLSVGSLPAGNSSGALAIDIDHYDVSGASWVTLYTSSATTDRRPSIAFDATTLWTSSSYPEVVVIPAGRYRVRVVNTLAPTTTAEDLMVRLRGWAAR